MAICSPALTGLALMMTDPRAPLAETAGGGPGHVVAVHDPGDDTVVRVPDPEWDRIQALEQRVAELERRLSATGSQAASSRPRARAGRTKDDGP